MFYVALVIMAAAIILASVVTRVKRRLLRTKWTDVTSKEIDFGPLSIPPRELPFRQGEIVRYLGTNKALQSVLGRVLYSKPDVVAVKFGEATLICRPDLLARAEPQSKPVA